MREVPDCQADRPNGTFTTVVSESQRTAVHRVPRPGSYGSGGPLRRPARDTPGIPGIAAVGCFYLYRPAVNLGRHPAPPTRHTGLRAAVNARLEEISFRTGLITAAIALVALIAAAGFYATTLADGSATVTVSAGNVPKAAPKAPAPAPALSTPATPLATAKPKPHKAGPSHPAHPASARPALAAQPQVQAPAPVAGWPGYGRDPYDYGQGSGGQGSGGQWSDGQGSDEQGADGRGFNGQGSDEQGFHGRGSRHGAPGFPGSGGFSGFGHGRGRGRHH